MKAKVMKVLNMLFWILYAAGLATLVYDLFNSPTVFEKVLIAINLVCLFFMAKNATELTGQNTKLRDLVIQIHSREIKQLEISKINNDIHKDNLLTMRKTINQKDRTIKLHANSIIALANTVKAKDKQIDDMKKYIYGNSI